LKCKFLKINKRRNGAKIHTRVIQQSTPFVWFVLPKNQNQLQRTCSKITHHPRSVLACLLYPNIALHFNTRFCKRLFLYKSFNTMFYLYVDTKTPFVRFLLIYHFWSISFMETWELTKQHTTHTPTREFTNCKFIPLFVANPQNLLNVLLPSIRHCYAQFLYDFPSVIRMAINGMLHTNYYPRASTKLRLLGVR